MAGKIQLTPGELQAQAAEMLSVREDFFRLFKEVASELNTVNGSWSPNLAHNFAGKIQGAQNTFDKITDLLEQGAGIANTSALSFESVDSQLAVLFGGNPPLGVEGIGAIIEGITDIAEKKPETMEETIALLESEYGELPGWMRGLIKDYTGPVSDIYEVMKEVDEGDYDTAVWKTLGACAETTESTGHVSVEGMSLKFLFKVCELVSDDDNYVNQGADKYANLILDAVEDGDIGAGIKAFGGYLIEVPGKLLFDAGGEVISGTIDNVTKSLTGASLSTWNELMYEKCGWSPGHTFNDVTDWLGDEWTKIAEGDVLTWDGMQQGFKGIGDMIGDTVKESGSKTLGDAAGDFKDWVGSWF